MRRLALTLVPLVLLACGREPAAPDAARFNFMNNPDNGNPRIVRYEAFVGLLAIDQARGLFSLQASSDRQFGCNGTPTLYTFMDVQRVLENPADPAAGRIVELIQARDVYIAVYRDFDGWEASGFNCADLFARRLGEGTGKVVYTDNDLLVFLRPNTNANAFGFAAQGTVNLAAGGTVGYRGVSRCVWDGEDLASLRCVDRIVMR